MIDGEVRNIEVKVLSVGLPLLDICTHWRLFVQEGSLLPDSVSLSESLSFSFLLQHQLCLSPKVASSGESNSVFLLFLLPFPPPFVEVCPKADFLSSSLIDHLVIGSRVVEVVFVPAGSVHVSVLQAHLLRLNRFSSQGL